MLEPRDLRMHREGLALEAFELYVKGLSDGELEDMLFAGSTGAYNGLPALAQYVRQSTRTP